MDFTLQCTCGERISISAIDAGRARACVCTREYQIPALMDLRQMEVHGEREIPPLRTKDLPPSFKPPAADTKIYTESQKLALMDRRGRLPLETRCIECAAATPNVFSCYIECEVPEVKPKNPFLMYLIIGLLFPFHALFRYLVDSDEPQVIGDEVVVHAPLRLCTDCAARVGRNPAYLRDKLMPMPLYQPLFNDYPNAGIRLSIGTAQ